MPAPHVSVLLALSFLLLLSPSTAHLDVCVDPRIKDIYPKGCEPTERLIHIPNLGDNLNHALHDWLWAVVHYLLNCASHTDTLVINEPEQDVSLCGENESAYDNSTNPPLWSVCVFHIVVTKLNFSYMFFPTSPRTWPNGTQRFPARTKCARRTLIGAKPKGYGRDGFAIQFRHFRVMNYFSRECGGGITCNGSILVPLADWAKRNSLETIKQSVREELKIPSRNGTGLVHVLMYDRGDARRRQWANSYPVYHRLKKDPRVEVRLVKQSPYTTRGQVEMYAWADILIAPHGAAMANSIFMERGTQVIEIWNYCDSNVQKDRFRRKAWTGWHSHLLGINLIYLQCHRVDGGLKKPKQLSQVKSEVTHGAQKVRIEELFQYLEPAIKRQVDRLATLRKDTDGRGLNMYMNFQSSKIVTALKRAVSSSKATRATGFGLAIVGPVGLAILSRRRYLAGTKLAKKILVRK